MAVEILDSIAPVAFFVHKNGSIEASPRGTTEQGGVQGPRHLPGGSAGAEVPSPRCSWPR